MEKFLKKLPKKLKLPKGIKIPTYNQGVVAGFNQCLEKIIKIFNTKK